MLLLPFRKVGFIREALVQSLLPADIRPPSIPTTWFTESSFLYAYPKWAFPTFSSLTDVAIK